MYHRVLVAGRVGSVVAGRHGVIAGGPVHHTQRGMTAVVRGSAAALPGKRWAQQPHYQGHQQQACGLSSNASQKPADGAEGEGSKARRTEEQAKKVAEHKAAEMEYRVRMTALRKEVQREVKDKREADAVTAALERRRIAKRQAAAHAERKKKAAISIALNEERKLQLKENYEAGYRESARVFFEREERKKNIHAILLEELEAESEHWINTPEDVTAKITDDLWEVPGNNTAEGQISMPDEHLWRFSADVGLYNQEEEPSERDPYLRSRMYSRMQEMHTAGTYARERRTRWDNDTRGLLKEADRLLRKKRPGPPGYMSRLESSGKATQWKPMEAQVGDE
ncbi:unnamed protein product [Ectocarpus sp. 8 AP-2014]